MMKKVFLIACLLWINSIGISLATHIVGGDFSVKHLTGNNFELSLKLFRDCNGLAGFDPTINIGVYDPVSNVLITTIDMDLTHKEFLELAGENCDDPPSICVENGIYVKNITLAPNPGGYYLSWDRCCRNHSVVNILNPGQAGMTFYLRIPDPVLENSSPHFISDPLPYMCEGQPFKYDFSAFDADGDSLVYRLATPLSGNSSQQNPNPGTTPAPYPLISWVPGYGLQNIANGPIPVKINAVSGELTATPGASGIYAMAIEVDEFRNGVKIGMIRREIEFTVILCTSNIAPSIATSYGVGNQVFNLYATDTLKFNIYIDDNNDTIFLSHYGSVFGDSTMALPYALSNDTSGVTNIVSRFFWPTNCNHVRNSYYEANFRADDVGCPFPFTSLLTYKVYINAPLIAPSINMLCTQLYESDSLSIRFRDSLPWSLRKYISYYLVYRNINGSAFQIYDTIFDTRTNYYTDPRAIYPNRINYGYYFIGINICDIAGPTSEIIYSFDAVNQKKIEIELVSVLEGDNRLLLQWKEFPDAQFSSFYIYRKDPGNGSMYNLRAILDKPDFKQWIDESINADRGSYSYYMINKDECNNTSQPGNIMHSLFLSGENKLYTNILHWNVFQSSNNALGLYQIFKSNGNRENFIPINQTIHLLMADQALDINYGEYFYKVVWSNLQNNLVSSSNDIQLFESPEAFLSSAFTPNNDGINDSWGVVSSHVRDIMLMIYNRYGELVYKTNDKTQSWNGKMGDKDAPIGTYIYQLNYTGFESSAIKTKHGIVNLIR